MSHATVTPAATVAGKNKASKLLSYASEGVGLQHDFFKKSIHIVVLLMLQGNGI